MDLMQTEVSERSRVVDNAPSYAQRVEESCRAAQSVEVPDDGDDDDEEEDEDNYGSDGDSEEEAHDRRHKKRRAESARLDIDRLRRTRQRSNSVVFGTDEAIRASGGPRRQNERVSDEESELSDVSDDDQAPRPGRARACMANSERRFFDVPGITCVGCNLDVKVSSDVDKFVEANCTRKQPAALWRLTSQYYDTRWRANSTREGICAPRWSCLDIQMHYEHHALLSRLSRVDMARCLRGMRHVVASRMLREGDEESNGGALDADKTSVENYIKIVAAESREHDRLNTMDAPAARSKSGAAGSSYVPISGGGGEDN